jgi:proline dehydrogenase
VVLLGNVGGEKLGEVVPTMKKLAQSNVGSILDLAIEADLDAVDLSGVDAQKATIQMVNSLKECIDIASHQPESFIAVKITALAPPSLLQAWSTTLLELRKAFAKVSQDDNLSLDQFTKLSETFPGLKKLDLGHIFRNNDLNNSGTLSYSDLTAIFSLFNIEYCRALIGGNNTTNDRKVIDKDLDTAALIIPEIKKLCEYAQLKKVKLMMDAEQTYFQPAIDDIVIGLARTFNSKLNSEASRKEPLIFNTYQMYLVDSLDRLKADVFRASQKGYSFGIKLVRGAYMVSERERAMHRGSTSPIHPNIEETHKAYNSAVEFIVKSTQKRSPWIIFGCRFS